MNRPLPNPTLFYVHDPMCSWCWAFAPVLKQFLERLPEDIEVRRLLGGLAPDTDEPMPEDLREMVQSSWRRIQQHVPDTELNFAFWTECKPRRSTYASCRAVIAARRQDARYEPLMNTAIQRAYYTQARNPSDEDTLVALAGEIGLDVPAFVEALNSSSVREELEREIEQAREMDIDSFPALAYADAGGVRPIAIDYRDPEPMLRMVTEAMARAARA
jgi:putative protein-disulfide isomerase